MYKLKALVKKWEINYLSLNWWSPSTGCTVFQKPWTPRWCLPSLWVMGGFPWNHLLLTEVPALNLQVLLLHWRPCWRLRERPNAREVRWRQVKSTGRPWRPSFQQKLDLGGFFCARFEVWNGLERWDVAVLGIDFFKDFWGFLVISNKPTKLP